MSRPARDTVETIAFVASVAVLGFLYGYATRGLGWFPDEQLERAWRQAKALAPSLGEGGPLYIHRRVYERSGARVLRPGEHRSGLTAVTSAWLENGRLKPGVRLIDEGGEVLHQWLIDPGKVFASSPTERRTVQNLDIQGSYLFRNGDILVNLEYAGTARLDACGRLKWSIGTGSHHSIERAADGSFWIPGVTAEPRLGTPRHPDGLPGVESPVYQDQILRVASDGSILDTITVLDVLYANDLAWLLADEDRLNSQDPTHLNDVDPLPDSLASDYPGFEAGDLAVSLRHLDLVVVLDPESERVKWQRTDPWIRQHDPDWMGNGWIGVFDNRWDGTDRGTLLGGSRVVAVQPHTDSVKVLFPTPKSERLYTAHRGKWQPLPGGNMLLTEEEAGRVVEVAPDGRTVWEWIHAPIDGNHVPAVTQASRVTVTRDQASGWPCAGGAADVEKAGGSNR